MRPAPGLVYRDGFQYAWIFGMPSIGAWQLLFWALGVAMMYFLAYTMQMSTVPETEVEALAKESPRSSASGP